MAATTVSFKPDRIQRDASFEVNAPIEKAFPLFGPVRERDWAAGWEPVVLYSGHPEIEQYMIFETPSRFPEEGKCTWILTHYNVKEYRIEYTVSTRDRIWFITVQCQPIADQTRATVTYSYTGLTEAGSMMNAVSMEKMFARNLKDWEEAINHYLATGKQLK